MLGPRKKPTSELNCWNCLRPAYPPRMRSFSNMPWRIAAMRVRDVAARLLARLPHSALAQRMLRRAETMLAYVPPAPRGGLRTVLKAAIRSKSGTGTLTVTPPNEFDKEWERDGIQEKPLTGLGRRTYWMVQVMTLVPPSHWESRFACAFADLLRAAAVGRLRFLAYRCLVARPLLFQQQAAIQAVMGPLASIGTGPQRHKHTIAGETAC